MGSSSVPRSRRTASRLTIGADTGSRDGPAATQAHQGRDSSLGLLDTTWPVLLCILGSFRLLKLGRLIEVRRGGKAETLLTMLALAGADGSPRAVLMQTLWPDADAVLAAHALDSLVYSIRKLLDDAIHASGVVFTGGFYRLNIEAGIGVDAKCFDTFVSTGDQHAREGDHAAAASFYRRAIQLYRGDLCVGVDLHAVIERERLRRIYLNLLAHLADYAFAAGDYASCLEHALQLLARDPCREDAHRLAMRCYVRQGQRAQALHQYRLCEQVLLAEFNARPEHATTALFDQVRLDPDGI